VTVIPLPEWLPDLPAHMNPGLTVCKNVIPASGGHYEPVPRPSLLINDPAVTVTSAVKGAYTALDSAGNVSVFFGHSTFLKRAWAGSSTYDDVTRVSGSYQNILTGNWRFRQYGERVIATNFLDDVQSFVLGSSSNFAQLSADAPRARHLAVWNNFLVLGHLDTDTQGVRWSAIDDPTSFPAVGGSAAKEVQSDSQTLAGDHGWLMALTDAVANADGLIFMERAIYRATYVGPPLVFRFDKVEGARGTPISNSVIHHGNIAAYWSGDGFYITDGVNSTPIGDGKVDAFFREDLDNDRLDMVSATVDPERKLFLWNYFHQSDDYPKTLVYNWASKRWALWESNLDGAVDIPPQWIFRSATLGYTVDTADNSGVDIESTTVSPDDRFWAGGPPILACFHRGLISSSYVARLSLFTGSNWSIEIETGEADLGSGRRVVVQGIRPFVDTQSVSCSVGYRDTQAASVSYTTATTPAADGECKQRINTRYARAKIGIGTAVSWTKIWAYEPRFVPGGTR
jgi:hypothetical protein